MTPTSISLHESALLPILTTLCALIISNLPLPFVPTIPMPQWFILTVIYWTIIQRTPIAPIMLFLLGIIMDALAHCLIGTHAFLLIALQLYMQSPSLMQTQKKTLSEAWPLVMLMTSLYVCALALFMIIGKEHSTSIKDFALLWISTLLAYPLLHLFYQRIPPSSKNF